MLRIITFISDMMIPFVLVYIILYGYLKKTNIYQSFIKGAKDGFYVVLDILPTMIGLMVAVGILNASGALDILTELLRPVARATGYPAEVIPLTVMRLISSSASTGLLLDLFKTYGADSFTGRFVSVMMSCTETVFYTMSVYFMSVKITKTRYTLAGAMVANVAGIAASLWICKVLFP
jgi:spore maturation protein B